MPKTEGNRKTPYKDPYRQYNFKLELDNSIQAQFRECTGLDSSQDVIDYREGTDKLLSLRQLPGLVKYSHITLKRGITVDNQALWAWRSKAMDGKIERLDIAIVLLDDTGATVCRWELAAAWPMKWSGPELNATGNSVAIETIEIVHEGISKTEYK
jgi:phage tail-like protein